jgi:DNA-binding XRE family transcriptional regulator
MAKRRTRLMAYRIEAGYETQEALVNALKKDGVDISENTYGNIESGRNKTVDVILAFAIARKLNKRPEEIFLALPVQKMHRMDKTG